VHIEKLHSRNEACENLVLDKLRDADMSGAHVAPKKIKHASQFSGPIKIEFASKTFTASPPKHRDEML
jgi:hypothetical protein